MDLFARVRRFVREHDLLTAQTRVLGAVSGGADSVALAHILATLAQRGELRLAGLVHFNHQLRPSADADEQHVCRLAAALGVPFVAEREDVAARAQRERRSLEDAARAARYAGFERARASLAADVVALGHTRDDQAETFLLRLLRGAGPRGLAAMHPRRDSFVRPLLDCGRDELRAWLDTKSADGVGAYAFVDDESNQDVAIPRNRVRAELMPLLASRFNPAIVDVLAREAALARELSAWLDYEFDRFAAPAPAADGSRGLEIAALTAAPLPLRRLVIWRALSDSAEAANSRPIGFNHVASVLRLIDTDAADGARIDLPGHHAQRIGGRIVLTNRTGSATSGTQHDAPPNLFRYPLSIPGEVSVPSCACSVSAEARAAGAPGADDADPGAAAGKGATAVVRAEAVHGSLAVRNRRPGDRFRPVGLGGTKKLQDLFVDRKIRRADRDAVPLVVDGDDRIVWVAGHGIDEAFRVTAPAQAVLILKLKALGGSA